jgi:putative transposase
MHCRHKDFADIFNIVVVVHIHLASNRRGHIVLFSSDLALDARAMFEYYGLRFQIEFEFCSASAQRTTA